MKKKLFLAGVVLLLLLIPAAFLILSSSRQVNAQEDGEPPKREMVIAVEEVINGERFAGEVRVLYQDPPELPPQSEQAGGLFLSQAGDTFAIGTGSIEVEVGVEVRNDEEPVRTVNASHSGDTITVQFDNETVFFEDTTPRPEITPDDIEAGVKTLTRIVEPGTAGEMSENMMVRVWGNWQGDTLQADLVVYEPIG